MAMLDKTRAVPAKLDRDTFTAGVIAQSRITNNRGRGPGLARSWL